MKPLIDIFFDALLKRHNNDTVFWTNRFSQKIAAYERGEGTDWDRPSAKAYYKYLRNDFKELAGTPRTAMELGCGTGILSLLMAAEGTDVVLVDHLPEALSYAKLCELSMRKDMSFKGTVRYEFADASSYQLKEKFDLVHNCGVIEEMAPDQAERIVQSMKQASNDSVIVGVPNYYNPYLLQKFIQNGKATEQYYSQDLLAKLLSGIECSDVQTITSTFIHPKLPPQLNRRSPFGFLHLGLAKV